jgi:hypothetical protein
MKNTVSPVVVAIAVVVALAFVGYFAFRFAVPAKVLVPHGTPMPPMPQPASARVLPPK